MENPASPTSGRSHVRSLRKTAIILWIILSWTIAVVTVFAANGGRFDPRWWSFPAALAMTFPAWFIGNIISGAINAFYNRKTAIAQGVALILSLGAFWTFCPLNIFHHTMTPAEEARSFTFMSFNAFLWEDNEEIYPEWGNRNASVIINSGVDIICLQEALPMEPKANRNLTTEQLDSMRAIYPYMDLGNPVSTIFSKYPLRPIAIRQHPSRYSGFCASEIDIKGEKVLFVSVHLQSIGLSDEEKDSFREMTDASTDLNWKRAGSTLYHKLSYAFKIRAEQADMLRNTLDSLDYKNVILSGDFNDIGDCYALRTISRGKMKNAYSRAGFGPVVSYHRNRFFFNIDHILYEGALKIAHISHGDAKCSDHYPVMATFFFTDSQ